MTKATIAVMFKVDGEHLAQALEDARQKLDGAESELVLDFSSVQRVDSSALITMEQLANNADEKKVKLGLRSVNVDVYKVLKLAKLSPRFSFLS